MLTRKTVEFATPGTKLSIGYRQLVIERPGLQSTSLPIEDLGVVIVDDVRASYTQAVFLELLGAGATLIVSGRDHLPVGMMLPLDGHHNQTERHHTQIATQLSTRKRIWQELIAVKIAQQGGAVLLYFVKDDKGLSALATRVRSGDPDNLEAQAAQRYWRELFGRGFRRDRAASGINGLLNYGYAIMRAAIARAIVAAGLIPSIGVFHRNRSNPFCLADDLLEPYRPYVDWRVRLLVDGKTPLTLDDQTIRAGILSLFNETIRIDGKNSAMFLAIELSASSLAHAMTEGKSALRLPRGLPVEDAFIERVGM